MMKEVPIFSERSPKIPPVIEYVGEKNTVFVTEIMDQWYVVMSVSDKELFREEKRQMIVNVVICLVIFSMIAAFYYLGYCNEQIYAHRVEQMKMEEQAGI